MSLTPKSILVRKQGLPWQQIDDESLVLNPSEHEAHEFNETASFVWAHLDGKSSMQQIIESLADDYSVDALTVSGDVLSLGEELLNKGLVDCR